mmetsp:Transcript_117126/g.261873  ORF Transcript_117126/g.261873 Transcript_117126/m.261873 type:complete len:203 (+) Transcript_117126:772-1380(+)
MSPSDIMRGGDAIPGTNATEVGADVGADVDSDPGLGEGTGAVPWNTPTLCCIYGTAAPIANAEEPAGMRMCNGGTAGCTVRSTCTWLPRHIWGGEAVHPPGWTCVKGKLAPPGLGARKCNIGEAFRPLASASMAEAGMLASGGTFGTPSSWRYAKGKLGPETTGTTASPCCGAASLGDGDSDGEGVAAPTGIKALAMSEDGG